jgi:GT2 family glycosyltransferase
VVVVVLNWNNPSDTDACLASVSALDYPNVTTIVVDNGSTDDSVPRIRRAHPRVELVETGANLGYGEGNNVGMRRALERGAAFVLVLNNDTVVAPSMLERLVAVAAADPRIGMVGPLVLGTESPPTVFAAGSVVDWAHATIRHRGMGEPPDAWAAQPPTEVDFLPGCGVLVSRALLERCGMLDAEYYLNLEDVEWGVRARRHGFRVRCVPSAVLWHKVSATLGQESAGNTYYMTRNTLRFFWENAPHGLRGLATATIVLRTMRTVAAWTLRSRYRAAGFARRRDANVLALRDFARGRYGAMGGDVARVCSGAPG